MDHCLALAMLVSREDPEGQQGEGLTGVRVRLNQRAGMSTVL